VRFPAVCERLGISTSWVYCQHRDLARAIAARHLRQHAESMEQRGEIFRSEVFGIVKNMLDRGERPTRPRISKDAQFLEGVEDARPVSE
jgi:hypothetical protein